MSVAVAVVMVVATAAVVAYPFFGNLEAEASGQRRDSRERLEREKSVAMLALREADLDRAMGKLSEEDYGDLRGLYERRAVGALEALDALRAAAPPEAARPVADSGVGGKTIRFCTACGRAFGSQDRFCGACGHRRAPEA